MGISTYMGNKVLDLITGRANNILGGLTYIGVSTTIPNVDGTNVTEPTDSNYKRILIGQYDQNTSFKFNSASNNNTTNKESIVFNRAATNWGELKSVVFFALGRMICAAVLGVVFSLSGKTYFCGSLG